ncbi:MAG: S41 family peptidase [Acidobacteriota bacterium]|nr:S41 family peptidase [Acidobacteriota bacterium]
MKNNKINLYLLICLIVLVTFLLVDGRFLPGKSSSPQYSRNDAELVGTVMQLIKTDYLEEPNPQRTSEGAFRGIVNSLDALSAYLDKDLAGRYLNKKMGNFQTGLTVYKEYGLFPLVVAVAANSPAAKAGLKVGDSISSINDKNTLLMSLVETELLMVSDRPDEQPVKLRVVRGTDTISFELKRDYAVPRVLHASADLPGSLHLQPTMIYPGLANELKKALNGFLNKNKQKNKAVILDFRNCSAGDYSEAKNLINLFVKSDEAGYYEKKGVKENLILNDEPLFPELSLIIWVNQATMGPAELIAACLHELRGATVIGLETPGLVAQRGNYPLDDGSLVLLVTSVFTLKSGQKLLNNSLPVDIKLTYSDKIDQAYLDKTRERLTILN